MGDRWGLNRAGREIIRGMMISGAYEDDIISEINLMLQREGWDFQANLVLCRELATYGYTRAARYLKDALDGHRH